MTLLPGRRGSCQTFYVGTQRQEPLKAWHTLWVTALLPAWASRHLWDQRLLLFLLNSSFNSSDLVLFKQKVSQPWTMRLQGKVLPATWSEGGGEVSWGPWAGAALGTGTREVPFLSSRSKHSGLCLRCTFASVCVDWVSPQWQKPPLRTPPNVNIQQRSKDTDFKSVEERMWGAQNQVRWPLTRPAVMGARPCPHASFYLRLWTCFSLCLDFQDHSFKSLILHGPFPSDSLKWEPWPSSIPHFLHSLLYFSPLYLSPLNGA